MKKIYLACAYTHPVKGVMEARFLRINQIAGDLMRQGYMVFSPISHTHPIAVACDLPRGIDFWQSYDETFIDWADELWVYSGFDYSHSVGVKREIAYALKAGKNVRIIQ